MAYGEPLLDHFQHPRNACELPEPDAAAEGENPVCGDRLRIELRIRDGVIEQVRWQGEGCVPALAAASLASELLQGATLEDARRLDAPTLEAGLGGVPPRKAHALTLVLETVGHALAAYRAPAQL